MRGCLAAAVRPRRRGEDQNVDMCRACPCRGTVAGRLRRRALAQRERPSPRRSLVHRPSRACPRSRPRRRSADL